MPGLPHWIDFDQNILVFGKKRSEKIKTDKSNTNIDKSEFPTYTSFLKGDKIAIYNNNTQDIDTIDPLNTSGYLNPTISKRWGKNSF